MEKRRRWPILALVGFVLAIVPVTAVLIQDRVLGPRQRVEFVDRAGDVLVGTYVPGEKTAGVMLLEGFGSDQVALRSAAVEFARLGVHVFGFDFSGHGRSPGGLTFDNAATDRLAHQVLAAKEMFKELSGLRDGQIVYFGHSMGARAALQAATIDEARVAGLILLGAQVNLATNVQSEVFTGVSDADLPWVQSLGPDEPPVNVLSIVGMWDDVLTPDNARLLLRQLVGKDAVAGPTYGTIEQGSRTLLVVPRLLHNYEPFSPRVLKFCTHWAGRFLEWDRQVEANASAAGLRIVVWVVALAGLFTTLVAGERWVATARPPTACSEPDAEVTSARRFLWGKLFLWLAAIPLIAVLFAGYYFLPLPTPVFNLIYVGFIGGYGLLLAWLYRLGRVPGTTGRLRFAMRMPGAGSWRRTLIAGAIAIALLALTAAYATTGWFTAPPVGVRLVWILLFGPVTALGFWIGLQEDRMLSRSVPGRRFPGIALSLIGLVPFLLWTIFQAAIGSLSGMVGGVQGLIVLALVLRLGRLLQRVVGRAWLTALLQALLLYWLVLPQGVLFV